MKKSKAQSMEPKMDQKKQKAMKINSKVFDFKEKEKERSKYEKLQNKI